MPEQSVKLNMLLLLAFLLLCYGAGNVHCSAVHGNTDMLSLLDFKTATSDPTDALRSWNRSIHFCNWTGVRCSPRNSWRVAALELGGESLAGQITPSLGNLTFLETLNLSYNGFSGQLPPLHRLNMLVILDLHSNDFSGQIPSLGQLENLQLLDLSSNGFSGHLPSLSQLQELVLLDLYSNSLQGIIPDSVTDCLNITYLDLSENMLEGKVPAKIGSLHNLEYLGLSRNNLNGIVPPTLGNATNLEILYLEENQLGGGIPDELGQLSNLTFLALSDNWLSGRIPLSIFNLTSLHVLGLHTNKLEMALPLDIGDTLPSLQNLTLGNNMLKGNIPASLGNVSALQLLDLSSNSFVGEIPSFGNLLNLVYLNLGHNKLESSDSQRWESLYGLTNCTSLKILVLDNNQLQGTIPNSTGKFSTELTSLHLGGNNLSGIVPSSLGNLDSLIDLDLSKNNFIGTIDEWVGSLKKIQSLDLHGNNFIGSIPASLGNFTGLTLLSLAKNEFEGPIPPIMGNLPSLSLLNLSQNYLNGHIPKELFSPVSTMTTCILSYNNLEGPIPPEISNLIHVTELDLSSNNLSGQIPVTLGGCQGLEILLVDNNFLSGNIPKSINGLKSLSMLNLSHNHLSGFIPIELSNLSYLTRLDLSYNNLQGEIPRDGVFGNATAVSVEGNRGLCGGAMDLHMPMCPAVSQRSETQYYLVRALISIFGFTSLVMLTYIIFFGKKTSQRTYSILLSFGKKFPRVAYNDLARATGNFSDLNLVGRGSYGSVYRGKLTQAKIQVAIKVFDLHMKCADKSFVTECEVLSRIRHRNLVPVLTACLTIDNKGDAFKALIYEFMPNGNLDTWLHDKYSGSSSKCLNLAQRASIAIGIADALAYLHNDCERQIVHCDLKPTNILLDNDMNAYLGDFGIASLIGHSSLVTSTGLKGTIGYIAPEYAQNGQASILGDVYNFGIVLLEMLIGKRPTDPMFENELNMVNFVERNYPDKILHIIDPHLHGERKGYIQVNIGTENTAYGCLLSLMQVALSCTRLIPRERMNIREVTNKLHSIETSYISATKQ